MRYFCLLLGYERIYIAVNFNVEGLHPPLYKKGIKKINGIVLHLHQVPDCRNPVNRKHVHELDNKYKKRKHVHKLNNKYKKEIFG